MLYVSMSGPGREAAARLCVSGATLWAQGKWGVKMGPQVVPGALGSSEQGKDH